MKYCASPTYLFGARNKKGEEKMYVRDTYLCTRDILPPLKEDPALGGPMLLGTCMALLVEC